MTYTSDFKFLIIGGGETIRFSVDDGDYCIDYVWEGYSPLGAVRGVSVTKSTRKCKIEYRNGLLSATYDYVDAMDFMLEKGLLI